MHRRRRVASTLLQRHLPAPSPPSGGVPAHECAGPAVLTDRVLHALHAPTDARHDRRLWSPATSIPAVPRGGHRSADGPCGARPRDAGDGSPRPRPTRAGPAAAGLLLVALGAGQRCRPAFPRPAASGGATRPTRARARGRLSEAAAAGCSAPPRVWAQRAWNLRGAGCCMAHDGHGPGRGCTSGDHPPAAGSCRSTTAGGAARSGVGDHLRAPGGAGEHAARVPDAALGTECRWRRSTECQVRARPSTAMVRGCPVGRQRSQLHLTGGVRILLGRLRPRPGWTDSQSSRHHHGDRG
mmetsp:Transcript_45806/g.127507  ORF Transcript_45806/g.127507 Transcript_45806/m.127507 type:complete len:297 (+) Transcript_45806:945-1835(+)